MKTITNSDFLKKLQPIHKNHTARVYKKLMTKIYALKQSLKKRSIENNVKFDISIQEIKELFYNAYGKKCIYCNKKILTVKTIVCDHIVPLTKGGQSVKKNLQLICKTCNTRKGPLSEWDFLTILNLVNKLESKEAKEYLLRKLSKGGRY